VAVLHRRCDCRLCGDPERLELVLALTPTPPANAFVPPSELAREQERFPLDVFLCRRCGHAQLLDVLDPGMLFERYVYVSGTSPVFVDHFRRYAAETSARFGLGPGALVVEIGSNDGTLLRFYQEAGCRVLGVDPAREIARGASERGIETLPTFFTPELAERVRRERGPAALVAANNVFAHADDLAGIADGVRDLLSPEGVFVFEVSYLVDVYQKTLFDTIYHEHLAYHTVGPLRGFFERHGMELIAAERVGTHGGSLRGIVQKAGAGRPVEPSVEELVQLERELGLDRPESFRAFARRIDQRKAQLRELLLGLKREGKRVAGFGAPAKATTLMYHFELGPDVLEFIVDDSPLKQGLYSPGLHIPVRPASALSERRPDYLVVLAWNFAEAIIDKNRQFAEAGGRFIVPLPEVTVV
jgi:SAM-dependent methyltransferase